MSRDCYVVASGLPPHVGWQLRGESLRAEQLAAQARCAFDRVQYVVFLERLNLLRNERGGAVLNTVPDDVVVIPAGAFEAFCARIDPSVFIFSGSQYGQSAATARHHHTIVYDIAPERLDDQNLPDDERARIIGRHETLLGISARRFARLAEQAETHGAILNPLAPTPSARATTEPVRTALVEGASPPANGDPLPALRALFDFTAAHADTQVILTSERPDPSAPHSTQFGALTLASQVTALLTLSNTNRGDLWDIALAYMEAIAPGGSACQENSWQAMEAVAAGVPILCHSATEAAASPLLDPFPGEVIDNDFDAQTIATFVERARAGAYAAALSTAGDAMKKIRGHARLFDGLT
ncbi:MAG: hypothetical protein AAGF45_06100 [Pseudomonadota bacterium]